MTQIVVDQQAVGRLSSASEAVNIVDEAGIIHGTFIPRNRAPYDFELMPPLDLVELRRRASAPEYFTTAQVLAHLAKS